jgi:hypothetical protein
MCFVNNKQTLISIESGILIFWSSEIHWNMKLTQNVVISAPLQKSKDQQALISPLYMWQQIIF